MLVLTRKQMQGLCINGNIMVTVLKVRGNQVRLGREGPQGRPVRRQPAPARLHAKASFLESLFSPMVFRGDAVRRAKKGATASNPCG